MGNSSSARSLRKSVIKGRLETLQRALGEVGPHACAERLNAPLNRKGDTALILAVRHGRYNLLPALLAAGCHVNAYNHDNQTAVDVYLGRELPTDEDILHHHFCPYSHCAGDEFLFKDSLRVLLEAGGGGASLQRLILHTMKNTDTIHRLIHSIRGLARGDMYRISGLLLQVVVWFEQAENLSLLLRRGVDITDFWSARFVPVFVPNTHHAEAAAPHLTRTPEGAVYSLPHVPESNALQSLKFSFVQDWRADWRDGENPAAQYRAGLHLTPTSAVPFVRAAPTYAALVRVMRDVLAYLPPICDGPNLKDSALVGFLALAGYRFTHDERQHLRLKFSVDFDAYDLHRRRPVSLKHLCRLAVRFSIRTNVMHGACVLHCLPPLLKRYITLDDEDGKGLEYV